MAPITKSERVPKPMQETFNAIVALTDAFCRAHLDEVYAQLARQATAGSSTLNRGHEHQRLIRRCNAREGRPRCFGGTQRGSGT